MSARLVSLKPFRYASFMAVSISRVRLSGCGFAVPIVSQLTNSKPVSPCCQSPPRANLCLTIMPPPSIRLARSQIALSSCSRAFGDAAARGPVPFCHLRLEEEGKDLVDKIIARALSHFGFQTTSRHSQTNISATHAVRYPPLAVVDPDWRHRLLGRPF